MIIDEIKKIICSNQLVNDVDEISVGIINFKNGEIKKLTLCSNGKSFYEKTESSYYDLASVTKPLTIGLIQFCNPDFIKDKEISLLLNHCSGVPAWGLLSKHNWREQLLSYQILESDTLYSDFGAIRAQLEFERKFEKSLYETMMKYWDKEVIHWENVDKKKCLKTGERAFKSIIGDVHDPNAWVIKEKVAHAGLFSTIDGLIHTLLNLEEKFSLTDYFYHKLQTKKGRFVHGWDSVMNKSETLAGESCGDYIIGHLGFTGTSMWIDCEKKIGSIILTNATRDGWYNKKNLNEVRKKIGNCIWEAS